MDHWVILYWVCTRKLNLAHSLVFVNSDCWKSPSPADGLYFMKDLQTCRIWWSRRSSAAHYGTPSSGGSCTRNVNIRMTNRLLRYSVMGGTSDCKHVWVRAAKAFKNCSCFFRQTRLAKAFNLCGLYSDWNCRGVQCCKCRMWSFTRERQGRWGSRRSWEAKRPLK